VSLQLRSSYTVPEETARVARAAFPKGNVYMQMYEELGALYTDEMFTGLFPPQGQPAESPARLALVLVMQFAENESITKWGLREKQMPNAEVLARLRVDA
jgi:transposase